MKYYTDKVLKQLDLELGNTLRDLRSLMLRCVVEGDSSPERVREQLQHGAGRRVSVITRAVQNIYTTFPPETESPLARDALSDVQINLHAFVMNLYGFFDNLAWAFVLKHNLTKLLANPLAVGMFKGPTRRHLPAVLRDYLTSETMTRWHKEYLKNYRDALAHRIPLYIPPSQVTPEEGERMKVLMREKADCINAKNWARLDELYAEEAKIGRPSFYFFHSYSTEESPKRIVLHPQLLADGKTIAEFGSLFFQHWATVVSD